MVIESAIVGTEGLYTDIYMRLAAFEDRSVAPARRNILSCALGTESLLNRVYISTAGNCGSSGAEKGPHKYRHGEINKQETKGGERGDAGVADSAVGVKKMSSIQNLPSVHRLLTCFTSLASFSKPQ